MEKINSKPRYSEFDLTWNEIEDIFNEYGYSTSLVDSWVLDGWHRGFSRETSREGYGTTVIKING